MVGKADEVPERGMDGGQVGGGHGERKRAGGLVFAGLDGGGFEGELERRIGMEQERAIGMIERCGRLRGAKDTEAERAQCYGNGGSGEEGLACPRETENGTRTHDG